MLLAKKYAVLANKNLKKVNYFDGTKSMLLGTLMAGTILMELSIT